MEITGKCHLLGMLHTFVHKYREEEMARLLFLSYFSNIQSHLITIRMETKMGVRAAIHQELLYSIEPSLFLQSCG